MSPHHFTRDERLKAETYKSAGYSNAQIASELGFHKSSIGRELRRNSVCGRYHGDTADNISRTRRQEIERTRKLEYAPLRRYVIDRTMENWSAEQISGRLRKDYGYDPLMQVSHETIYTTAYSDARFGPLLTPYWRRSKKKRQKRGLLKGKREIIKGRVSIEERPQQFADRSRIGDLEANPVEYLVEGNPPMLNKLQDGRLCITYGFRAYPYSIRARLSSDNGKTWGPQIVSRNDGTDIKGTDYDLS